MMALAPLARHPALLSLGWALVHFLWQGAAVAALLAAAHYLLRYRSAQARYLAACAALLVMAACPILTLLSASRISFTAEAQRTQRKADGATGGTHRAERGGSGDEAIGQVPPFRHVSRSSHLPIFSASSAPLAKRAVRTVQATAVETLLFYHPGVWWVSQRIRMEREDDGRPPAAATTWRWPRWATG